MSNAVEELELIVQLIKKYNLPLSPILEYSIQEKKELFSVNTPIEEGIALLESSKEAKTLNAYIRDFSNLSVSIRKGKKVPHKSILLLSIIDLIESDELTVNKIELDSKIANRFEAQWKKYISNENIPSVWTPFYHLSSEPFWHFQPKCCEEKLNELLNFAKTVSIGKLRAVVEYTYLDNELFNLLLEVNSRNQLKKTLVDNYVKIYHDTPRYTDFKTLQELNLSEEDAAILFGDLRTALERMLPNKKIDASDYYVLTVFPFKSLSDEIPDDYEVENYEVGMIGTCPALRKVGDGNALFVLQSENLTLKRDEQ